MPGRIGIAKHGGAAGPLVGRSLGLRGARAEGVCIGICWPAGRQYFNSKGGCKRIAAASGRR